MLFLIHQLIRTPIPACYCAIMLLVMSCPASALDDHPDPLTVKDSTATTESEMKAYEELIEHSRAKIPMVPIPSGTFTMGSPSKEVDRRDDESPQHEVKIQAFWMGKFEITWDAYDIWMADIDVARIKALKIEPNTRDKIAEEFQLTKPTSPFTDMSFGWGKRGYPAICMTQHSARVFCQWISAKTGRYYRLPTEAEWEYACRAGTTTAFSFGESGKDVDDYAWYFENADEKSQKVGKKKPNPWGLYDMHGNVAEWVLDAYEADYYEKSKDDGSKQPLNIPKKLYPRIVRGGSWDDDPEDLRSAARRYSEKYWKEQDPQIPQSIWYHTDARHVGFRVVRPLAVPTTTEKKAKWDKSDPPQIDEDIP